MTDRTVVLAIALVELRDLDGGRRRVPGALQGTTVERTPAGQRRRRSVLPAPGAPRDEGAAVRRGSSGGGREYYSMCFDLDLDRLFVFACHEVVSRCLFKQAGP